MAVTDLKNGDLRCAFISMKDEGEIGNNAFRKAMVLKVSTIINAIKDNFLDTIIYSDIDVQFFQNFEDFIRCNILGMIF